MGTKFAKIFWYKKSVALNISNKPLTPTKGNAFGLAHLNAKRLFPPTAFSKKLKNLFMRVSTQILEQGANGSYQW